jgi:hypothetical protein
MSEENKVTPGVESTPHDRESSADDSKISLPLRLRRAIAIVGIVATAATIIATLAGVLITLVKLRNDELTAQTEQLQERNKEKEIEEQTAKANQERATVEREKAALELKSITTQAEIEREKAHLELEEKAQDRRVSEQEQLAVAIRNFQDPSRLDSDAEAVVIGSYLGREDSLKQTALTVFASRLEQPRTASEVRIILHSLPAAGIDALPIAIAANRKAFSKMLLTVETEVLRRILNESKSEIDAEFVPWAVGNELFADRPLSFLCRRDIDSYPDSASLYLGIYHRVPGALELKHDVTEYSKLQNSEARTASEYATWKALLESSIDAIEKILEKSERIDVLNLDRCFLPSFRLTRFIRAKRISFLLSYIVGSDLSGLSPGSEVALADAIWTLGPHEAFLKPPKGLRSNELHPANLLVTYEIRIPNSVKLLPAGTSDVVGHPIATQYP